MPRWRSHWPIWLLTWVILTFATSRPSSCADRGASAWTRAPLRPAAWAEWRPSRASPRPWAPRRRALLDDSPSSSTRASSTGASRPSASRRALLRLRRLLDDLRLDRCRVRQGGLLRSGPDPRQRQHLADLLAAIRATSSGRRSCCSATTVAFAMLIGFVVPRLFASTLRTPPSSSTARTPPPAMTPVPSRPGAASRAPHRIGRAPRG